MQDQNLLTEEIIKYIDKSVLCWLATSSKDNIPNVSPKQIFNYDPHGSIIVANIASPNSLRNIKENENVCISFIDIFIQKGFQIKGSAEIIEKGHPAYVESEKILLKMTQGKFPFTSITQIKPDRIKKIVAPSYMFYPETTTEADQIDGAKKEYLKL